ARTLATFSNAVAQVWAHVLRAGSAIRAGDKSRGEAATAAVEQGALAAGMKLTSAAARFRLAELRGDDSLLATASAEMTKLGIRVPRKMTALLFPIGER
ncbi:MAG TPA: hypothetical protein VFV99_05940, partial [Kofleriaceae bacterium]|nr:hypothetical protein [Kofleriaceae bacterium]